MRGNSNTTLLPDLDGLAVEKAERLAAGTRRVHLTTADDAGRACRSCGVFAVRVKGFVQARPWDLLYGERKLELAWRKRRRHRTEPTCPHRSFTEQVSQVPAGPGSPSGCGSRPGGECVTPVPRSSEQPATRSCPGPR
ncbi:hypothetical protein [Streptomyces sp. NPDC007264]|uniref:hypothetical protein n=1 Tax=Streptomyces sp. NPDC007264 TaxID=3364777 RepID=UPI0036DB024A